MLIVLPPSEGKRAATAGAPADPEALSFPELGPERRKVMDALAAASGGEDALRVLGVGDSLAEEVRRNTALSAEPAAPAHDVYTGVLFEALGYAGLDAEQRRRAAESVVVVSALWGAVGFGDRIPAYRLSMSVDLPGIGRLASWWKPRLADALGRRAGGGLVVDCRSSTYAAAWAPAPQTAVAVSVVQLRQGARKVVSHFAKHTRGEVARHLLVRGGDAPESPGGLLEAVRERWEAELSPATARKPHQLTIVLPEDHSFAR